MAAQEQPNRRFVPRSIPMQPKPDTAKAKTYLASLLIAEEQEEREFPMPPLESSSGEEEEEDFDEEESHKDTKEQMYDYPYPCQ
jgi:hypothetical protein